MAVEIKQLVIRAVVDPPKKALGQSGTMSPEDRAELIAECMDEIQKMLKREKLR